MSSRLLLFCAECAFAAPFLAIALILVHYHLRRAAWRRKKRKGQTNLGFCPSSAALGMIFLFAQTFYRPSVSYEAEARQVEQAEDDDEGEPETPAKHLNRQLHRIRRGEPVDRLMLRL